MHSKSKLTILPQIFVNGEYRGLVNDLEDANEAGKVTEWLKIK